jgi:hypothetical protein
MPTFKFKYSFLTSPGVSLVWPGMSNTRLTRGSEDFPEPPELGPAFAGAGFLGAGFFSGCKMKNRRSRRH